jgi:RNA polymerase sigma factor (sigma-70 family)
VTEMPGRPLSPEEQGLFKRMMLYTGPIVGRRLGRKARWFGHDVEDLLQDAYILAMKHWDTVARLSERQQLSWIATTAAHLLVDQLRTTDDQHRDWSPLDETSGSPALPADEEELFLRREDFLFVPSLIRQLSGRQQSVVILYGLYGFTYKEIAELLNIKRGTVSSHMNRAKTRLKLMKSVREVPTDSGEEEGA